MSAAFAPVRARSLKIRICRSSSDATDPERTRTNHERDHCDHAANAGNQLGRSAISKLRPLITVTAPEASNLRQPSRRPVTPWSRTPKMSDEPVNVYLNRRAFGGPIRQTLVGLSGESTLAEARARARDGCQAARIVFQAAVSSGYNQRSTCRPSRYRKMLMTRVCSSTPSRRAPIVLIAQTW